MSDLISRKATINTVINMRNRCDNDINDFYDLLIESFKVLPSAETKKGKWKRLVLGTNEYGITVMYKCSECEEVTIGGYSFCPHCGTQMEVME